MHVCRAPVYALNSIPPLLGLLLLHAACIPRLLEVGNYLNNYFSMYARLTCFSIREELVSLALLGLKII